ncbi:MAG: GNAT family N-acetyltransferase [Bacteroidales bacterium]|nr:GNAT family N-acetyltransferase [Bacteroidales bacterium]
MEPIIEPISPALIQAELTPDKLLRKTNKANNELYVITHHDSPNTMLEIGRLREEAYRFSGGGTGKNVDIDQFDTMEGCYKQLIVWNPDKNEIMGGYRYIYGKDVQFDANGIPQLSSNHLFNYSDEFVEDYLPYTIELGRSFVTVGYQSSVAGSKALFAMDNLWDGLGALIVMYPDMKYFFGKVTMYPNFGQEGRNMILYFLNKQFPDPDRLVYPRHPLRTKMDLSTLSKLFIGGNFKENYKILNANVRELSRNIPPLVNAYMNLSPTMRVFGTAINDEFGDVEETGIMINVGEIFEDKRDRHIATYIDQLKVKGVRFD